MGIIGLIVNLKTKTMAIIGTSLAIASVVLFLYDSGTVPLMSTKSLSGSLTVPIEASSSMEREEESDLTDDSAYPIQRRKDDNFMDPRTVRRLNRR